MKGFSVLMTVLLLFGADRLAAYLRRSGALVADGGVRAEGGRHAAAARRAGTTTPHALKAEGVPQAPFSDFHYFEFVSDFGFRISDFGYPSPPESL